MTDEQSLKDAISASIRRHGRVDAVVNTAYPRGKGYGLPLEEVTYESFCENLDLHLGGYFLVTKVFSEYFAKQKHGHVINFASVYGIVPPRFEIYEGTEMTMPVEYAAIKSGIISLSKYFTKMYLHQGVRFNCVAPGGVFDNQPDSFVKNYSRHAGSVGMVSPAQVSDVVVFLLSQSGAAINGQTLVVDDGWSL
jgi:NAD(P)-dependent dehydrogenase (short-subunit alcohol dehydrogenase family)